MIRNYCHLNWPIRCHFKLHRFHGHLNIGSFRTFIVKKFPRSVWKFRRKFLKLQCQQQGISKPSSFPWILSMKFPSVKIHNQFDNRELINSGTNKMKKNQQLKSNANSHDKNILTTFRFLPSFIVNDDDNNENTTTWYKLPSSTLPQRRIQSKKGLKLEKI